MGARCTDPEGSGKSPNARSDDPLASTSVVSANGGSSGARRVHRRRVPILFGPLIWVDVIAANFTDRQQRLFELLTSTVVIDDRPAGAQARDHVDGAPRIRK